MHFVKNNYKWISKKKKTLLVIFTNITSSISETSDKCKFLLNRELQKTKHFRLLRLDDANRSTRRYDARHNIRVYGHWVGHVTVTDQWGFKNPEAERRSGEGWLRQWHGVCPRAPRFNFVFFLKLRALRCIQLLRCVGGHFMGRSWLYHIRIHKFIHQSLAIDLKGDEEYGSPLSTRNITKWGETNVTYERFLHSLSKQWSDSMLWTTN